MTKRILMAIMFATAIAFAADAAKTPAAALAKTEATIPDPAAASAEAAPVAVSTSVDVREESSFNPIPLAVGGFGFVCLLVIGVWRSRRRAVVKVAEPPTGPTPSVAPTGESEPNKPEPSISDELQKVNAYLQELKKAVQEKEKLLQMNVEMHEELVGLRNGLADSIKKPLLMGLIQIYDRLEDYYTWAMAMVSCPRGWHLPNKKEWKNLLDNLVIDWSAIEPSMMTGGRNYKGEWNGLGSFSYYWTSDAGNAGDDTKGSIMFSLNGQAVMDWTDFPENGLQSVRCVQD